MLGSVQFGGQAKRSSHGGVGKFRPHTAEVFTGCGSLLLFGREEQNGFGFHLDCL